MNRILSIALLACCTSAFAQTPAAPAAAAPTVEPLACAKPTLPATNKQISDKETKKIEAAGKAYIDCIKAYVEARKAAIASYTALGNANAEAANAATGAANAYLSELNNFNAERQRLSGN